MGSARVEKKDGGWAVIIEVGRDADGKRKRIVHRVKGTKKQAEQVKLQMQLEYGQGVDIGANKISLADYLQSWLAGRRTNLQPRTYESYKMHIDRHLIPALGHIALGQLAPTHIEAYKSRKLKEPRAGQKKKLKEGEKPPEQKPLTARTVDSHLTTLSAALNRAVEMQLILRNPVSRVERPGYVASTFIVLEEAELEELLAVAEAYTIYPMVYLAAYTGMRLGEVLGLEWADVDLTGGTVFIHQQWQRTENGLGMGPPKSDSGVRRITISDSLVALLQALRQQSESKYVFPGESGPPGEPSSVDRAFKRIAIRFGRPDLRYHDLRHTHATILLAHGVPIPEVQKRLGHKNASTTMIYLHTLASHNRTVSNTFELAMKQAKNAKKK